MTTSKRYSWTQPVCDDCWNAEYPDRSPVRLRAGLVETCCKCGLPTRGGIYIRVDPQTIPFPTNEKDV